MKSIRTGMRCLPAAFLMTAAAHANSVVYIFAGADNSGASPEPEAFQLTVPDFIDAAPDGSGVDFTCDRLDSSTNCGSPGVIFSDQSVLGAFSAQLQFDSPISGSIFDFPSEAFTAPGVYSSEAGGINIGALNVQEAAEPGSIALTLSAGLLFLFSRVKKLRSPPRWPRLRTEPRA
jgi:subtilisin family serine protease